MLRGLYTAYTGMRVQQDRLDIVSNNLANVNTTGFKKDDALVKSFDEVLAIKIKDPETANNMGIGKMSLGARIDRTYVNHEQGSFQETGDSNNVAIEGNGMFAIGKMDSEGNLETQYTRDGSFMVNQDGLLVTKDGYFVIGNNGPINMKNNYIINDTGLILEGNTPIDQIKLVDFEDYDALRKLGSGNFDYKEDANLKPFEGKVVQGFLESSNVNSVNEMVNMINIMRTYESNQKVMTTYDETLDKAVNQVGRV